jgi:hypothetical protein
VTPVGSIRVGDQGHVAQPVRHHGTPSWADVRVGAGSATGLDPTDVLLEALVAEVAAQNSRDRLRHGAFAKRVVDALPECRLPRDRRVTPRWWRPRVRSDSTLKSGLRRPPVKPRARSTRSSRRGCSTTCHRSMPPWARYAGSCAPRVPFSLSPTVSSIWQPFSRMLGSTRLFRRSPRRPARRSFTGTSARLPARTSGRRRPSRTTPARRHTWARLTRPGRPHCRPSRESVRIHGYTTVFIATEPHPTDVRR